MGPQSQKAFSRHSSDRVPGTGRGGNRELDREGNKATPPNKRPHVREDLNTAGLPPGTGGISDMWLGEPQKIREVSATLDCQEVKTRKNLTDYLIQTTITIAVGQMGARKPRVGGLLWEPSQQWLLLPLLLPNAAAPVAMGTSLTLRVSLTPPSPSFPSNGPPPRLSSLRAWQPQPGPQSPLSLSQSLPTMAVRPNLGFLGFWLLAAEVSCPPTSWGTSPHPQA